MRANRSQSRRPVGRSQHHSRTLSISRPRGTAASGLESGARFGASQGFSGVGDLQSRKMRELLSRAAEDLVEPLDTLLMRYVDQVAVAKNIRQAVWAGVRPGGTFSAAQRYRLHATNVSANKIAKLAVIKKVAAKVFASHAREVQTAECPAQDGLP